MRPDRDAKALWRYREYRQTPLDVILWQLQVIRRMGDAMGLQGREYMGDKDAGSSQVPRYIYDSVQDRYMPPSEWEALQATRAQHSHSVTSSITYGSGSSAMHLTGANFSVPRRSGGLRALFPGLILLLLVAAVVLGIVHLPHIG
jgi:hypothetical protein